jgi:predicted ArsR family transcriptional regulator
MTQPTKDMMSDAITRALELADSDGMSLTAIATWIDVSPALARATLETMQASGLVGFDSSKGPNGRWLLTRAGKPDHYDPLPDTAQLFAAVMHTAVTGAALDVEPLMRIASRLGIDHGTGAPAIEAKLRGIIEFRVRREMAREILSPPRSHGGTRG